MNDKLHRFSKEEIKIVRNYAARVNKKEISYWTAVNELQAGQLNHRKREAIMHKLRKEVVLNA